MKGETVVMPLWFPWLFVGLYAALAIELMHMHYKTPSPVKFILFDLPVWIHDVFLVPHRDRDPIKPDWLASLLAILAWPLDVVGGGGESIKL
jgi:hypothetical protein